LNKNNLWSKCRTKVSTVLKNGVFSFSFIGLHFSTISCKSVNKESDLSSKGPTVGYSRVVIISKERVFHNEHTPSGLEDLFEKKPWNPSFCKTKNASFSLLILDCQIFQPKMRFLTRFVFLTKIVFDLNFIFKYSGFLLIGSIFFQVPIRRNVSRLCLQAGEYKDGPEIWVQSVPSKIFWPVQLCKKMFFSGPSLYAPAPVLNVNRW